MKKYVLALVVLLALATPAEATIYHYFDANKNFLFSQDMEQRDAFVISDELYNLREYKMHLEHGFEIWEAARVGETTPPVCGVIPMKECESSPLFFSRGS